MKLHLSTPGCHKDKPTETWATQRTSSLWNLKHVSQLFPFFHEHMPKDNSLTPADEFLAAWPFLQSLTMVIITIVEEVIHYNQSVCCFCKFVYYFLESTNCSWLTHKSDFPSPAPMTSFVWFLVNVTQTEKSVGVTSPEWLSPWSVNTSAESQP